MNTSSASAKAGEAVPLTPDPHEDFVQVPDITESTLTTAVTLPADGRATLEILDIQGGIVRRLVDDPLSAGQRQVRWTGDGRDGQPAPAGLSLARLRFRGRSRVLRIAFLP